MDNQNSLPTNDALDMAEAKCPPPGHAEKCRKVAQEMANVERLLYRVANGDKAAAVTLKAMCQHKPYDGCILVFSVEELLFNVLE